MSNIRRSSKHVLKYTLIPSLATAFLGLSVATSPGANAGETASKIEDVVAVQDVQFGGGAAERIEAADIMRVLTQTVPSAACHYHNGIAPEESKRLLVDAKVQFGTNLAALRDGNDAMQIYEPETRRKTLHELDKIKREWLLIEAAVNTLIENPNDTDALKLIKSSNLPLLDQVSFLLSELEAEYANPAELLQVDVMRLEFSGRQSMLTQKLAKEACEIWTGNRSDERLESMRATINLFEVTLNALRDGMPAAGIAAPPTSEIQQELDKVTAAWADIRDELTAVLENGEVSDAEKALLYKHLNEKMYEMEHITHLYAVHSKHEY